MTFTLKLKTLFQLNLKKFFSPAFLVKILDLARDVFSKLLDSSPSVFYSGVGLV